jgi:hypothetical protein
MSTLGALYLLNESTHTSDISAVSKSVDINHSRERHATCSDGILVRFSYIRLVNPRMGSEGPFLDNVLPPVRVSPSPYLVIL